MQKRNQCLFPRTKISVIALFNKPILESLLVEFLLLFLPISSVYCFLFWKLHNKNAKIGILEDVEITIFFAAHPWWAALLGNSQK